MGLLSKVLNPQLSGTGDQWLSELASWEMAIDEYHSMATERLPDSVLTALLIQYSPPSVRQHLQLNSGQLSTFAQCKTMIEQYLISTRAWSFTGGGTDMEVDALYKKGKGGKDGKGKGNGKDNKGKQKGGKDGKGKGSKDPKGKSKGKSDKSDKKEGQKCWICNGNGHFARDCKKRGVNAIDGATGSGSSGSGQGPPGLSQTNSLEASLGNLSILGITCCEEMELVEANHLLIDSGCEAHMMGKSLLEGHELFGEPDRLRIRSAGGHILKHYGQANVQFWYGTNTIYWSML
jgi:hypothetical protein